MTTSANGALTKSLGTISIAFPPGTVLPAALSTAAITAYYAQPDAASVSGQTITLTVGQGIPASTEISVILPSSLGIHNPGAAGDYSLDAWTSAQPLAGTSQSYAITN
jgi:hypothetical protein